MATVHTISKSNKDSVQQRFYTYILECNDGTLYVGATNDLTKRVHEHNHAKNGAHYTKIRRPVVLKYSEHFATLAESRAREASLKRLTRIQKMGLISQY